MTPRLATSDNVLEYYQRQSAFTEPGACASLYDDLPDGTMRFCQALQNTILHTFWIGEDAFIYQQLKPAGREICIECSVLGGQRC